MNSQSRICCFLLMMLYSVILHAQDNHWSVNIYDYQYDMSIYAKLQIEGVDVTDYSDYEFGAFVDDECRAVGTVQSKSGYTWIYLRPRSNSASGEKLTFKMYSKTSQEEITLYATETITFLSQSRVGMPSSPITLDTKEVTLGDVNNDGVVDISDVNAVITVICGIVTNDSADVNADGVIDISDVNAVISIICAVK